MIQSSDKTLHSHPITSFHVPLAVASSRNFDEHVETELPSGFILDPLVFERACWQAIKINPSASLLPIRIALAMSTGHCNRWMSVNQLYVQVHPRHIEPRETRRLAEDVCRLGLATSRQQEFRPGCVRRELQLTCPLIRTNGCDGRMMQRIARDLDVVARHDGRLSPLVGLVLVAVYLRGGERADRITRFFRQELDVAKGTETSSRVLRRLADLGLLHLEKCGERRNATHLVLAAYEGGPRC
jgi:hypothetical protein